jgi:outer membrane protein assembly factor BamB
MKIVRIAALLILFLLGTVCLVWYFRTGGDADDSEKKPDSGMLLTDISPLGELSVLSDGTLAAGNARGEVVFLRPGQTPQTVSVTPTSISAPVAEFDGVCYVGDEGGTFAAFTPERGVLWTFRAGNQITGGAVRDSDGLVWFGSHDHSLYALDASGKLVHEVECQGQINGAPVFDGSFVYLGSCDGRLRKVDIHTGKVVKELDFESYIPETPVLSGGVLYVLTHGGELAAVNADSFDVLYRVKTEYTFFTPPFVTDSCIFLTDSNGKVHVHKRADGSFIADLPGNDSLNPIYTGSNYGGVYTISRRGVLSFFEAGSWKQYVIAEFPSDFKSGVTFAGNCLAVPDEYGNVFYVEIKKEP